MEKWKNTDDGKKSFKYAEFLLDFFNAQSAIDH